MVPFEAERAVLAMVLSRNDSDNQFFLTVSERLAPRRFESDAHRFRELNKMLLKIFNSQF